MKLFLLLVLLYISVSAVSQDFAIENTRENIAYAGIPSFLHCVVNGYPLKVIRLTTDNGFIKKETESGRFIFVPEKPGPATITVSVQTSKSRRKIGTYPYRIHASPPPRPIVGSFSGGPITVKQLVMMGGIRGSSFPDYCTNANPVFIVSFSAIAFSADRFLFSFQNSGPQWNRANITKLESLDPGATIIFNNIVCQLPYNQMQKAEDLIFHITESSDR